MWSQYQIYSVKPHSMAEGYPKNAELVGKVKAICQYPVKALRGRELQEAECIMTGVKADGIHDRYVAIHANQHNYGLCFYSFIQYVYLYKIHY